VFFFMDKVKFDSDVLKWISFFDRCTGVAPRDCFVDDFDCLVFVVPGDKIGLAIGKGGLNVRRLRDSFKRSVRVVGFDEDVCVFVKNVFRPVEVGEVSFVDGVVCVKSVDVKNRGLLIGRGGSNLRNVEGVVRRFFEVKEVRVE